MKAIPLTHGYEAIVDDDIYEFLIKWKWRARQTKNTVYAVRWGSGIGEPKTVSMHRVIMGITDPTIFIDHIDHNGLNCLRSNMRLASRSSNAMNKPKRKIGGQFEYKGICWYKQTNRYRVTIFARGVKIHVGYYLNLEEAALAYNEAALIHHGEFACLNEIKKTA